MLKTTPQIPFLGIAIMTADNNNERSEQAPQANIPESEAEDSQLFWHQIMVVLQKMAAFNATYHVFERIGDEEYGGGSLEHIFPGVARPNFDDVRKLDKSVQDRFFAHPEVIAFNEIRESPEFKAILKRAKELNPNLR